jgi:hypothetical protein
MQARIQTLAELLSPIDPTVFLNDYWERRPLHIIRPGFAGYSGLLSMAEADEIVSFNNRTDIPPFSSANRGPQTPHVGAGRLPTATELYFEGSTLLLGSLHQRRLSIAQLCRNIEGELRHPIGATAVLSPKGAQGLPAHCDGADVFCLQLEGEKTWEVCDPVVALPLTGIPWLNIDNDAVTTTSFRLQAGDLLYVPRGFVHQARTSDQPSLHLSMYVNVIRWKDLVEKALLEVSERCVEFRQALPVGFLSSQACADAVRAGLVSRLRLLNDEVSPDGAVEKMLGGFISLMEQVPASEFQQINDLEAIGPHTLMEKRPGSVCQVRGGKPGQVEISFPGGVVSAPSYVEPALHFIVATERFTVREVDLNNEDSKVVLCRRLAREGLLQVAHSSTPTESAVRAAE